MIQLYGESEVKRCKKSLKTETIHSTIAMILRSLSNGTCIISDNGDCRDALP